MSAGLCTTTSRGGKKDYTYTATLMMMSNTGSILPASGSPLSAKVAYLSKGWRTSSRTSPGKRTLSDQCCSASTAPSASKGTSKRLTSSSCLGPAPRTASLCSGKRPSSLPLVPRSWIPSSASTSGSGNKIYRLLRNPLKRTLPLKKRNPAFLKGKSRLPLNSRRGEVLPALNFNQLNKTCFCQRTVRLGYQRKEAKASTF